MKKFVSNFCLLISIFYFTTFVSAQLSSYSVARYIDVKDSKVQIGSVITQNADDSYSISRKAYDSQAKGVIVSDPKIYIRSTNANDKYALVNDGNAKVLTNTSNGLIKRGDMLRTSTTPGVVVKADKAGFVVGRSLQDYSNKNKSQSTLINVEMNIHFAPSPNLTLADIFSLSALASYEQPLIVFKYVVAAFITLLSFILGFFYFGRIASRGIEALGRNPLASRSIQFGIVMNVIITCVIIGVGVLVSLFIIRI